MRVGEMMVVIRAQDFASRTMRRVGGEFAHLSREQQQAFRRQQLAWQKYDAKASRLAANESMRQLNMARDFRRVNAEVERLAAQRLQTMQRMETAQARRVAAFDARRTPQGTIGPATGNLRLADRLMETYSRRIGDLDRQMEPLVERQGQMNRALSQYPTWVRRAAQSTIAYADGISRVSQEYQRAWRNLATWQQNQLAFDQAMQRLPVNQLQDMGHALGGIGRTMQLFGAVSTVAMGAAANAAANFNTEISLAATQARDIGASADQIGLRIDQLSNGFNQNGREIEGVLDLMERFPASQSEMAAGAYEIFSGMQLENKGIVNVAKGLGLLEDANKIAVAGGVSLEEGTSALITVLNNFDPQLRNTTEQFDTMFDIVRFGRMTMSDFNVMMNKIAPAAKDAGQSLEDVGGAMAYLTTVMPSQRMVATGISRLMEALRHPDIRKGLKMLGVDALDANKRLRPLPDLLTDIAEIYPELTTGQMSAADFFREVSSLGRGGASKGVIFTQEGRRALSLLIANLDEFLQRQREIEENTGEFGAAYEAQLKSLGQQWDIFMNRIRAVVVAIGADAIPVFVELGQVLKRFLDFWQSLDEGTRQSIVRFITLTAVATALGGAFLAIVGAFMGVEAMFRRMVMGAGGATTAVGGLMMILRRMAAIGVIALLIKVSVDGPPGWQDLASGGIFGAILGKRWGKMAMVKGAIVIPVILAITGGSLDEVTQRFNRWLIGTGKDMENKSFFGVKWGKGLGKIMQGLGSLDNKMQGVKKNAMFDPIPEGALKKWQNRLKDLEKDTPAGKARQAAMNAFRKARKQFVTDIKEWGKAMATHKEEMERHKNAVKEWGENLARATSDARVQAVDSMRSMYMELQQINEQAMGALFQGPHLTSESFNIAEEWGVTPGIEDLIRDLNEANQRFAKWRKSLDALFAKGVPDEMVNELRRMGPEEGQGYVDAILKGTPRQRQALIAAFKRRNEAIKSETKMDFVDEIERFRRAGVNMGTAIKQGFQEAQVGAWFDNWITSKFPNVINTAVNQAVAEWRQANPRPVAPKAPVRPVAPKLPPGVKAAAGATSTQQTTNNSGGNTNITINMGDSAGTAREQLEEERRLGFIIRQATRGRGR